MSGCMCVYVYGSLLLAKDDVLVCLGFLVFKHFEIKLYVRAVECKCTRDRNGQGHF